MQKRFVLILCCIVLSSVAFGQYSDPYDPVVTFDYLHGELNESRPLPAEKYFRLSGAIDPSISMIKLGVLRNARSDDTLYANAWRRAYGNTDAVFNLPVHYKLRGNDRYTLVLSFYRTTNDSEKVYFSKALAKNLEAYIRETVEAGSNKFLLRSPVRKMEEDLNRIVRQAFTYYDNGFLGGFPGFSDVVKNKLQQISDIRLRKARYNVAVGEGEDMPDVRGRYAEQLRSALLEICMSEVSPYIGSDLMVLQDVRAMRDYPTERTRTVLAVNGGYGAVYLSGDWDDLSYDSQPYVGVSFPLGNHKFSRFMGNMSISTGIFLRNFHDEEGNKMTGPVIGLPFYLGAGYRAFRFIRFNVGVVATSKEKSNLQDVKVGEIRLKPFVGISAELNLWLGTDR